MNIRKKEILKLITESNLALPKLISKVNYNYNTNISYSHKIEDMSAIQLADYIYMEVVLG